jgi:Mechanosensitive ion channel, conserved TM helix
MWEQVDDILRRAAIRTVENVANFLPGLIGLMLILLGAAIIAILSRRIVFRALQGVHFDQRAERWGFGVVADWSAAGGVSALIARIVMWVILIAGLLAGFSALDAALPEAFARTVFRYIPNVIAALVILVVGTMLSRFLARSVLIGAVNLHWPSAHLWSTGVKWLVLIVTWVMALEHLDIGRRTLTLAFGILFGGIVLALALAIGLGAKDVVSRSIERQQRDSREAADKLSHV